MKREILKHYANRAFLIIFCTSLLWGVHAQNTDFEKFRQNKQQKWVEYKDSKQKAWAEYRAKVNKEYADKMSRQWQSGKVSAGTPIPKSPDPPKPVVKTNQTPVPTRAGTVKEYIPATIHSSPQPFQPIARPVDESEAAYVFDFHNTPCKVHLKNDMKFSIPNAYENTVSEAWRNLSDAGYDVIADDCLNYRDQLDLNDWGYIELIKELSNVFVGVSTNESALMQAYLLAQSGYKVRLARADERLVLMIPFSTDIYKYSYFSLDGEKYYVLDDNRGTGTYYIFNEKFPGEKTASLEMKKEPRLFDTPTPKKTFSSVRYPDVSAIVSTNKNLMEFYNSIPVTSNWGDYAKASLSRKVKRALYPVLKKRISGKTETEAANILLNFVQTAFQYKTDGEQFGYERPLFGDELFYYPYSDCEDRSILFSILVRDLLHLEVVLLNYPGHLATAVNFTNDVSGHYFNVNGKKYVLCDPTYIGAPIGDCMPQFVGTGAIIVEIGK